MSEKTPPSNRKPHHFSSPDSFGLFMDALRELQLYEDECARTESSQEKLNQHLDEALENLQEGHRQFPDDLLTQYYLAIALTMKNQRVYAQALNDYNEQFRKMQDPDPKELKAMGTVWTHR